MRRAGLLLLALLSGPALGAYITDRVAVGLYAGPGSVGEPVRVLAGATPVEILRREGDYAEVRLTDGKQGWVEARQVSEEKPAQVLLLEAQARAALARRQLEALRQEMDDKNRLIADLQKRTGAPVRAPHPPSPVTGDHAQGSGGGSGFPFSPWSTAIAGAAAGFLLGMYLFLLRRSPGR